MKLIAAIGAGAVSRTIAFSMAIAVSMTASASLPTASETWQKVALPGNAAVIGMGESPFPDGQRSVWASTSKGSFRLAADQWQAWPLIDGVNPSIRDLLIAPDEQGKTSWWLATPNGLLLTVDGQSWTHHHSANSALVDNDIQALHLSQSSAGQPEVWIGSRAGLTIWRMGQWEAVLARPDGFQGGVVSSIRGLLHNGQRQIWVAGPAGLSRFQAGRWQRWAAECLRGHRLNAIQTLEHQGNILLLAGTDRALLKLSLDDPGFCQPVASPMSQAAPALALARDRHERLYVLMPHRVERFGAEGIENPDASWTFFDHRDGLGEITTWQGGHRLDAEGRLWAGSGNGLWTLQAGEPPGQPERLPILELGHRQARITAGGDTPLSLRDSAPALNLHPGAWTRPHALRYRFRMQPATSFGPWQHHGDLKLDPLAFGRHHIEIEMADGYGRVHGPYVFPLKRQWPWAVISGVIALVVLVLAAGVAMRRRRS